MKEDQMLFEIDMERQYEDPSWGLDYVNSELQLESDSATEEEIESAYDEMLQSILQFYYPSHEEFDF